MYQGIKFILGAAILFASIAGGKTANYVVINTNDSGDGSLRQAIINADSNNPPNTISFQIPGSGPFTISPQSTFPPLNQPVIVDGTTQPGYGNSPLIQINAAGISSSSDVLTLSGGGSTITGLSIFHSKRDAIRISGLGTNIITGCYLGVDASGTNSPGNVEAGVYIYRSSYNVIGGTNTLARNVLSGNMQGIEIDDGPAPQSGAGNVIQGNYIGTTYLGTTPLGNTNNGIFIISSPANQIGGASSGAKNLISGNFFSGIYLSGISTSNNVISGNFIGTDITGAINLSNKLDGITILGASGNRIGGTNSLGRNILSGNGSRGILIINSGSTNAGNNVIQGNFIGTDVTGRLALPNQTNGIILSGVFGNLIGGTNSNLGNVISGNVFNGITIYQPGASNNLIWGNYIGTDATGTNALPNTYSGITISGVTGNTVGGTNTGAGNLISGNLANGVYLQTAGPGGNFVQGNLIGSDITGRLSVSNNLAGIWIESSGNWIGGSTAAARNLISGNGQDGIYLTGAGASNNIIQANYIGTDIRGTNALPNGGGGGYSGIYLTAASANTIGGTIPGMGNVISGNGDIGISLNAAASANIIQGNYIGADATGTRALANGNGGVYLYNSPTNTIGGTNAGAGNLISGNNADGIYVSAASGMIIQGNYIGTKIDGATALGNLWHNVEFDNNANNNLVGGTVPTADNRIAFTRTAQYDGVRVRSGCVGNQVLRNSFFSNGGGSPQGLGITVGNVGVTTNGLPVFTNAITGKGTVVRGSLLSTPNTTFLLQIYANVATNLSGYGEGLVCLGSTNITTDATGKTTFATVLATNVPAGEYISGTVTDSTNNTSEFAADILVQTPPVFTVTFSNSISGVTSNYYSGLRTNPVTHVVTTNAPGWLISTNYLKTFYLTWPTNPPGFSIVQSTSLAPSAAWVALTNQPQLLTNQYRVLLPITNQGSRFFRLLMP